MKVNVLALKKLFLVLLGTFLIFTGCTGSDDEPKVSIPEEQSSLEFADYILYYQADSVEEFSEGLDGFLSSNNEYGEGDLARDKISGGAKLYYPASEELISSVCAVITPVDKNNRSFTIGEMGELGSAAKDEIADVQLDIYTVVRYDGESYTVKAGLAQEQIADNYDEVRSENISGIDVSLNCRMVPGEDGASERNVVAAMTFMLDGETIHIVPMSPREYTEYLDLPAEFFELESVELSDTAA